jgi:hypothetical protein
MSEEAPVDPPAEAPPAEVRPERAPRLPIEREPNVR